jgi:hypothetical protein
MATEPLFEATANRLLQQNRPNTEVADEMKDQVIPFGAI